ncbi:alanine racemase [Clostridium isatidis]|uniref:Alanine racemase n=1 Tax=Clostridium isatidis TaxID=182773 RepID=A0A343JDW7_9CLOT|nr:alanine racemase [Clostridium isatidis]ASW43725.1 alanine racemase [Clostridium isatidis]NLZ33368.1 alanine racemase [Clostridiales bacterium]
MDLLNPMWAEINIDNLIFNINQIKMKAKNSEIIGVVKANAYGHGAIEISKILINNGIKKLAVANVVEGIELRENGINTNIMLLGLSTNISIPSILKYNLEPTVSSYEFAYALNDEAKKLNKTINIHIAIDSGMGRIGFRNKDESIEEIEKIFLLSNIKVESIFSHFSTADAKDKSYSYEQMNIYNKILNDLEARNIKLPKKNLSNSAAIIDLEETHFNYIRPGIILYGYYPSNEVRKDNFEIRPVLTWKTKVIYIKEVEENQYIGYNKSYKTSKKTKIATIPVGYADGYSRGLSNKGKVIINGKFAPIIGNICMDQFMVDVTDIDDIKLEDEVILLGAAGDIKFDADDMAKLLNTISYEILCLIGRRAPRIYLKNSNTVDIKYQM